MSNKEDDMHDIKFKVGLLEKDVETVTIHVNKLDGVIEAIKELNEGISQMIAIHEEKHNQIEREERRLNDEIALTNKKLFNVNKELTNELKTTKDEIIEKINVVTTNDKLEDDKIKARISEIEKRMWLAMGGLAVIVFLVDKIFF